MGVLKIRTLGDPVLREKAKKVSQFDDPSLQKLIDDMVDTMIAAPGVGLAAPQVGVSLRVIVVKPEDELYIVINPEIVKAHGGLEKGYEGCLSIPGWIGEVERWTRIVVKGKDRYGKDIRIRANDFLARVFQHEIDHLDGILYIDKLTDPATLQRVDTKESEETLAGIEA
jgi:peptide deformylase